MKYRLIIILILLSAPLLTACGNNGQATQEYLEILQSGTYTLSGDGVYEGVHSIVLEYVDGENFNIRYRNANDSNFRFVYSDGVMYRVLDGLQLYAQSPENMPPHNMVSNMIDYDYNSAVYTDSGKQTVQGTTYKYDAYTLNKKDGEKSTLHIYTNPEGGLYAIALPEESIVITLNQLSPGVPEEVPLTIPEGFREVDYDQLDSHSEL